LAGLPPKTLGRAHDRKRMILNINPSVSAALTVIGALFITSLSDGQSSRQDSYQKHLDEVRRLLPPNSALPPLLDLSKPNTETAGASRAWENRFTGSMGVRPHLDPGVKEAGLGSITTTTTEYGGPMLPLPARSCDTVVVATPIESSTHLAYNSRLVYSRFVLQIVQVLKGKTRGRMEAGGRIDAAQLGGTLRFPSGHVETFLLAREGFLSLGKRYLLFIWKPVRSDATYMIDEAYLIQSDQVFPIDLDSHEARYEGMPFKEFEAKVKAAIAKNLDTN
jgi:hypothetical protein